MMNRSYLGHVSELTSVLVEVGQLQLFCKAIRERRSIHVDVAAAIAAGYRSIVAPPTFGTCLSQTAPNKGPSFDELGLDYRYLLHGEEHFKYHGPICAGDTISMRTTISDMFEKKGGALEFMVTDTTLENQFGDLVAERKTIAVMRHPREARDAG